MKRAFPLLLLFAASCASGPDQTTAPAPMKVGGYNSDSGPSPVGVIPTARLHDARRNRDVEVSIEYPTRGGPFPVIVFSHGYGGSNQSYEPLIAYWTSNGYVCIRPSHADARARRQAMDDMMTEQRDRPGRRGAPRQPRAKADQTPPPTPMENIWEKEREPQWRNRAADIVLVLDSLDELERRFPELQGKMDHSRIGVGGHSYGAFTAMLLAGMAAGDPPLELADPRVHAVIAMSPQGVAANRGTTPRSWAGIHIPVLYMAGSNDRGAAEGEDANWRKQAFDDSPPGDKYFVLLEGAGHMAFTGATGFAREDDRESEGERPIATSTSTYAGSQGPRRTVFTSPGRRAFEIIQITSLVFWNAELKHDAGARTLLQPPNYDVAFSGGATMTAK